MNSGEQKIVRGIFFGQPFLDFGWPRLGLQFEDELLFVIDVLLNLAFMRPVEFGRVLPLEPACSAEPARLIC